MNITASTTAAILDNDTYDLVGAHDKGNVATTGQKTGFFQPNIRVTVSVNTGRLKATFNPVSVERDRRTALLNETVRLGYRPARASTK